MSKIMILLDDWLDGKWIKNQEEEITSWPIPIRQNQLISIKLLSIFSWYEADGEPTEYFWSIDRKIQFGKFIMMMRQILLRWTYEETSLFSV